MKNLLLKIIEKIEEYGEFIPFTSSEPVKPIHKD